MGFKTEFNWVLKLKPEQGLREDELEIGTEYRFFKEEYRTYPLNIPIDLVNSDWEAVAKVIIIEFNNFEEKTTGKYKVIKKFNEEERKFLSNYWQENLDYLKEIGAIS